MLSGVDTCCPCEASSLGSTGSPKLGFLTKVTLQRKGLNEHLSPFKFFLIFENTLPSPSVTS